MLRRQAIVKTQYIHRGSRCQLGSQGSGIDAAARGISTTVAVQDHIFFHMGAVHADPLRFHTFDLHRTVLYFSAVPQQFTNVILGLSVLLQIRILHKTMGSADQLH